MAIASIGVAVASVLSGAAVAIGVPFINARLENDRIEERGRTARFEELRGLLDTSLLHLYGAHTILYEVDVASRKGPGDPRWPKRAAALRASMTKQADVLVKDGIRITLRVPAGDRIASAHQRAEQAFLNYEAAFRDYLDDGLVGRQRPPSTPISELDDASTQFTEATRRFVGVAKP